MFGLGKDKNKVETKDDTKEDVVVVEVEPTPSTDGVDGNVSPNIKAPTTTSVSWFDTEGKELIRRGTGIKTFVLRCATANGIDKPYGDIVKKIKKEVDKQDFEAIAEKLKKK